MKGLEGLQQRQIIRPPSPDRLDEMLRIRNPLGWLTLLVLGVAAIAALAWSSVSTAAVKVDAHGILLAAAGVVDVPAPSNGRLRAERVEVGDVVWQGEVVAEIAQPDLEQQLAAKKSELDGLRSERKQLAAFQQQVRTAETELKSERTLSLHARIENLVARAQVLSDLERNSQALFEKGIATRDKLLDVQNERMRNDSDLAEARGVLLQIASETQARDTENARELLANQTKIDALEREIGMLEDAIRRDSVVLAPTAGRVSEISATAGEMVTAGAPLLRILPDAGAGSELLARLYVSGGNGKRVKVGMNAQVVPSTARLQRDGFIEGEVIRVADLPATPESIQNALKNSAFVQQLTSQGPLYEVLVRLARDPHSPSGFKWSTGRGTPTAPDGGTIVEAKFVVDRIPLIALVIPRTETVLGWLQAR